MKIGMPAFQARFVERAPRQLPEVAEALDRVTLSPAMPPQEAFRQVALALVAVGIPALAAFSQEVARDLVTPAQEQAFADTLQDVFESRQVPSEPPLDAAWERLREATGTTGAAPLLIKSPLVFAQADSRNLMVGVDALHGELADPNVLLFSLAHEEGHRQHRDTAGTKGLEALLEACQDDPQLASAAFAAVREGRHENERQADLFGARVARQAGCEMGPILQFLGATSEDAEHPDGAERAADVARVMQG